MLFILAKYRLIFVVVIINYMIWSYDRMILKIAILFPPSSKFFCFIIIWHSSVTFISVSDHNLISAVNPNAYFLFSMKVSLLVLRCGVLLFLLPGRLSQIAVYTNSHIHLIIKLFCFCYISIMLSFLSDFISFNK